MGLFIRKSVRVGPFRFNLSKSGIGLSAGVTGFRIGRGPRGNYIHMGRGGVYYRTTLNTQRKRSDHSLNVDTDRQIPAHNDQPTDTHDPLQDIESGSVTEMVDSSSKNLVDELNEKRRKLRVWPFVAVLGGVLTFYLHYQDFADILVYLSAGLAVVCTVASGYRDMLAKTTVMLYEIDEQFQNIYESLHQSFGQMAGCQGQWHMEAEGRVKDGKYHAGAQSLVRRKRISLSLANPPYIKTNVATPSIPVGNQTLYFFPDMVLIVDRDGVGAVSYENLSAEVAPQRFIEDGSVPGDAQIVDYTWKYVNKRGGPDKRFKDNRQLPIALYEDVHFTSDTGLNERIELSRTGVSRSFANCIREVGKANRNFG